MGGGLQTFYALADATDLLHIGRNDVGIESASGLFGRLFAPDAEIDLATLQLRSHHAAQFDFLLTIERCNACVEVEGFAVERLHLNMNFLSIVFGIGFAVTCH